MSKNVKNNLQTLEFLKHAPVKIRKLILENSDEKLVNSICEICFNLCKGNIQCEKESTKKLKKHRKKIRSLAVLKRKDFKKKKEILMQGGGSFLPILLTPILDVLTKFVEEKKN